MTYLPGTEGPIDAYPTPDVLWADTFAEQNIWRDLFGDVPFNDCGGFWQLRYYQHNGTNEAIAASRGRPLHTLACAVCDERPCICRRRRKVRVKLADGKERTLQHIAATTFWGRDGKPLSAGPAGQHPGGLCGVSGTPLLTLPPKAAATWTPCLRIHPKSPDFKLTRRMILG